MFHRISSCLLHSPTANLSWVLSSYLFSLISYLLHPFHDQKKNDGNPWSVEWFGSIAFPFYEVFFLSFKRVDSLSPKIISPTRHFSLPFSISSTSSLNLLYPIFPVNTSSSLPYLIIYIKPLILPILVSHSNFISLTILSLFPISANLYHIIYYSHIVLLPILSFIIPSIIPIH